MGLAPKEVIDHAIDRLLIAWDDAAGENDRVALLDLGVLVVVDRSAGQRRHRLALSTADQYAHLLRREVFHFAGIDNQPFWSFDVSEVFGNLRRIVHRAPDEGD